MLRESSVIQSTILRIICMYLYAGTGNPCAGHNKVKSSPRTRSYPENFASLENFGFFVATGSNYIIEIETLVACWENLSVAVSTSFGYLCACTYTWELGTPARDTTESDCLLVRDRTKPASIRSKTSVSSWRLVLITRGEMKYSLYDCINFQHISKAGKPKETNWKSLSS